MGIVALTALEDSWEIPMISFNPEAFFDLTDMPAAGLFKDMIYIWDAVAALPGFIEKIFRPEILGEIEEGAWLEPGKVQVGKGSRIERGAIVRGPTIIGENSVVRTGAYIRGHVMVGKNCLIGHGTELRQTLVLDRTNIPHLNCFFTSLVGNQVQIGGDTHTANRRLSGKEVVIRVNSGGVTQPYPTGQALFGAVIGDDSIVSGGCLLQAGTIIGRRSLIFPQCSISGYIPDDSMVRPKSAIFEVTPKEKKESFP
jgi:NDP-sugar pyrophosphorylase family protein